MKSALRDAVNFTRSRCEHRLELLRSGSLRTALQFEEAECARLLAKERHICDEGWYLAVTRLEDHFRVDCTCGTTISIPVYEVEGS